MKEYIFGERNGIYIIDLQKTLRCSRGVEIHPGTWHPKARLCCSWAPSASPDAIAEEGTALWWLLCEPAAGWRTAHQLGDGSEIVKRLKELDEDGYGWRLRVAAQKRSHQTVLARAQAFAGHLAGIKDMNRFARHGGFL